MELKLYVYGPSSLGSTAPLLVAPLRWAMAQNTEANGKAQKAKANGVATQEKANGKAMCIVTQAMEAYQLFCSFLLREECTMQCAWEDISRTQAWLEKYKQEHPEQWWGLKTAAEIEAMLWMLPLNTVSFVEVSELVNCLRMM